MRDGARVAVVRNGPWAKVGDGDGNGNGELSGHWRGRRDGADVPAEDAAHHPAARDVDVDVVIRNVYVKFYTDLIGLDPKYVAWVYLVFDVWNILKDPVFGVVLDKMR